VKRSATDYDTYKQIMDELLMPIAQEGLDLDTLRRLYQSKLVYLENLRVKCFREMNGDEKSHFSMEDYQLVLKAISETHRHVRDLILLSINDNLARRKVV
jgi:hypothetical protein